MDMTQTSNAATGRRLLEGVFSEGDLDLVDDIMASDSVGHIYPDELHGPEGVKQFVRGLKSAFPDFELVVLDTIEEGDQVAFRWVARGTHEGELQGIPPTGKAFEMTGITIERFEDGEIVEGWTNRDLFGLFQQLGLIDVPEDTPEATH